MLRAATGIVTLYTVDVVAVYGHCLPFIQHNVSHSHSIFVDWYK